MHLIIPSIIFFLGYAIGRIGHILGGHTKSPHHWIYGLILVVGGIYFLKEYLGVIAVFFGLGVFVSDLNDFLHLKFYGVDDDGEKRFWGID